MDKTTFFESLSFLTKFETTIWPPKIKTFSTHVILTEVALSVEVVDKGPILVKNKGKDPAMFGCDLVSLEALLGSPSSASTSLSQNTPKSSTATTPRRSQDEEQHQQQQSKMYLIIRIDKRETYRIDPSRLLDVTLEKSNRQCPASIVLQFDDCLFRVFSTTSTDRIQAAYNTLFRLPRVAPQLLETSVTMSKEEAVESTKRKLETLERGWNETVQSFFYAHKLPSSPNQVSKRLNTAASCVSFASTTELEQAVVAQHEGLEQSQQELDDLLTAYFPRRTNDPDAQPQLMAEECIEKAQALMTRKAELLEERHKLAFLTTRG
mmetsp:Transcript_1942/g.3014  ORF Transcript_1942/g.3014 Transcript_1942/m.3014 type:complete len:322 (-) Transcript_1942:159-1124(-)|eukprot:CAMPEP_0119009712 /NCGR_PEP_ID=MMETSP1176-20130426/4549_1 /TAXON_ID=265551 /ORGANISM="Synedropsis recta cf, Strain CCMP1620" /LENGTH=321 /DNA_ID=CAMNT_0006962277 /DNA_START=79 /DNA_END=1044 /DNA_ORIENTATION=-